MQKLPLFSCILLRNEGKTGQFSDDDDGGDEFLAEGGRTSPGISAKLSVISTAGGAPTLAEVGEETSEAELSPAASQSSLASPSATAAHTPSGESPAVDADAATAAAAAAAVDSEGISEGEEKIASSKGAALLALVAEAAEITENGQTSPGGASVSSTSSVGSNGSRSKVSSSACMWSLPLTARLFSSSASPLRRMQRHGGT